MGVMLAEKSGRYYFKNFGDDLRLAEVIVGPESLVSRRRIERALGPHSHGIKISKARLVDALTMVEDEEFGCVAKKSQ